MMRSRKAHSGSTTSAIWLWSLTKWDTSKSSTLGGGDLLELLRNITHLIESSISVTTIPTRDCLTQTTYVFIINGRNVCLVLTSILHPTWRTSRQRHCMHVIAFNLELQPQQPPLHPQLLSRPQSESQSQTAQRCSPHTKPLGVPNSARTPSCIQSILPLNMAITDGYCLTFLACVLLSLLI